MPQMFYTKIEIKFSVAESDLLAAAACRDGAKLNVSDYMEMRRNACREMAKPVLIRWLADAVGRDPGQAESLEAAKILSTVQPIFARDGIRLPFPASLIGEYVERNAQITN